MNRGSALLLSSRPPFLLFLFKYARSLFVVSILFSLAYGSSLDMTAGFGRKAPKTPEEGADTAIWLATLPDDGPRGGFFRDRKPIPW